MDAAGAVFDLPESSVDHGQDVAGYYFWLFPNRMLNFYSWGLSVNVVQPLGVDRTRVSDRGSTTEGDTHPPASKARITFTACWPSSYAPDRAHGINR